MKLGIFTVWQSVVVFLLQKDGGIVDLCITRDRPQKTRTSSHLRTQARCTLRARPGLIQNAVLFSTVFKCYHFLSLQSITLLKK